MAKKKPETKKKTNPLLGFLFAIVIPFVVIVTILTIIFTVAGVDVVGWAKETGNEIPGVSKLVTTDKENEQKRTVKKLNEMITEKDEKIEQLNQTISNQESTIEKLEQDLAKVEQSAKDTEENKEDNSKTQTKDPVKTISASFKNMESKQAAAILQKMDQKLAVSILQSLSNDVRGKVFEAMDPELAAVLTEQLVNSYK